MWGQEHSTGQEKAQVRTGQEWVKWKMKVLVAQPCSILCDPMDCSPPDSSVHGISRQEHWSGLPLPSPGDLPDPGIELRSPALQADYLSSEPPGKPGRGKGGFYSLFLKILYISKRFHNCSLYSFDSLGGYFAMRTPMQGLGTHSFHRLSKALGSI